jgi:hypothetical protein
MFGALDLPLKTKETNTYSITLFKNPISINLTSQKFTDEMKDPCYCFNLRLFNPDHKIDQTKFKDLSLIYIQWQFFNH